MSPALNKAHVSIILVRPQSPGNIGSVARVMRNMGFGRLVLVAPERFPHPEARMMASGARDLLEAAAVHDTLAAATATCHWLAGTSARQRQHRNMPLTPRLLGDKLPALCQPYRVGLVFGPEDAGLTTAELDACHDLVAIPTSPEAPSLNLAQAVAVVCYEISQPRHAPATAARAAARFRGGKRGHVPASSAGSLGTRFPRRTGGGARPQRPAAYFRAHRPRATRRAAAARYCPTTRLGASLSSTLNKRNPAAPQLGRQHHGLAAGQHDRTP